MPFRQYHHEKRFKDLFFVLLYLIATGFFIFLVVKYAAHSGIFSDGTASARPHKSTGYPWLDSLCIHLERAPEIVGWNWIFSALGILFLTVVLLVMFCAFPLFTIHFVFLSAITMFLGMAIWQFMTFSLGTGFFWFFLVAGLLVLFLYVWSFRRLHFTALVIQNSLGVVRKYPGLFLVMLIAFLLGFLLLSVAFVAISGAIGCALSSSENSEPFSWFRFIFICLYLLWSIEILINWIHSTICGVFGCYYFYGDDEEENRGAVSLYVMFRTLFYTWGSLIFGSLFTPFTDFMTCCLKSSSRRTSESLEGCGAVERCFGSLCTCCCGWMSSLVETFNSYAFVQVGICGKSFYESAIDTGYLLRERGFSIVMADLAAEEFTLAFSLLTSIAGIALASYAFLGALGLAANPTLAGVVPCAIGVAILLGFLLARVLDCIITACVIATSVCFSMDPNLFSRRSPELYYRFKDRYSGFLNV